VQVVQPSGWCGLTWAHETNPDGRRKQVQTVFDRDRDAARLLLVRAVPYTLASRISQHTVAT
jgi:hypothetical protein